MCRSIISVNLEHCIYGSLRRGIKIMASTDILVYLLQTLRLGYFNLRYVGWTGPILFYSILVASQICLLVGQWKRLHWMVIVWEVVMPLGMVAQWIIAVLLLFIHVNSKELRYIQNLNKPEIASYPVYLVVTVCFLITFHDMYFMLVVYSLDRVEANIKKAEWAKRSHVQKSEDLGVTAEFSGNGRKASTTSESEQPPPATRARSDSKQLQLLRESNDTKVLFLRIYLIKFVCSPPIPPDPISEGPARYHSPTPTLIQLPREEFWYARQPNDPVLPPLAPSPHPALPPTPLPPRATLTPLPPPAAAEVEPPDNSALGQGWLRAKSLFLRPTSTRSSAINPGVTPAVTRQNSAIPPATACDAAREEQLTLNVAAAFQSGILTPRRVRSRRWECVKETLSAPPTGSDGHRVPLSFVYHPAEHQLTKSLTSLDTMSSVNSYHE